MRRIVDWLSILSLRFFSLFPLWLLYGFAWLAGKIMIYLVPYRRKIVLENLENSFPGKDKKELKVISRKFYRYFAIMIVESVKMYGMSLGQLERRVRITNPEYIRKLFDEKKSVIVIAAHYCNWEWILGIRKYVPHYGMAIYKPLNNKYINRKITRFRSRYLTRLVSMRDIPRVLLELKGQGIPSMSVYFTDQSPVWEEIQYWTKFLNQMTPVYLGPEKLASKFGMAVVYFRTRLAAKGYYEIEVVPITEDASKTAEFEITEKHVKLLEKDIIRDPQYWLWTHRRWKLTKKREEEEKKGIFRFDGQFKKKDR